MSTLPTLLEVIQLIESSESALLEAEISRRRQRLGGQTLSALQTRRAVQLEHLPHSQLIRLYEQVLQDPDASDDESLRRDVERRLLLHLRTLLAAQPCSFNPPTLDLVSVIPQSPEVLILAEQAKAVTRAQVEELAQGMVLLRVADKSAWTVVLEWGDRYACWSDVDWLQLEQFAQLFPEYVKCERAASFLTLNIVPVDNRDGLAKIAFAAQHRLALAQIENASDEDMMDIIQVSTTTGPLSRQSSCG